MVKSIGRSGIADSVRAPLSFHGQDASVNDHLSNRNIGYSNIREFRSPAAGYTAGPACYSLKMACGLSGLFRTLADLSGRLNESHMQDSIQNLHSLAGRYRSGKPPKLSAHTQKRILLLRRWHRPPGRLHHQGPCLQENPTVRNCLRPWKLVQ